MSAGWRAAFDMCRLDAAAARPHPATRPPTAPDTDRGGEPERRTTCSQPLLPPRARHASGRATPRSSRPNRQASPRPSRPGRSFHVRSVTPTPLTASPAFRRPNSLVPNPAPARPAAPARELPLQPLPDRRPDDGVPYPAPQPLPELPLVASPRRRAGRPRRGVRRRHGTDCNHGPQRWRVGADPPLSRLRDPVVEPRRGRRQPAPPGAERGQAPGSATVPARPPIVDLTGRVGRPQGGFMSDSDRARVGFIGTGGMARAHLRDMVARDDTTVVAICEPSEHAAARAMEIFDQHGLPTPPN